MNPFSLSLYLSVGLCNGLVCELFRSGQLELMYFPFHVGSDIVYISAQAERENREDRERHTNYWLYLLIAKTLT